MFNSTALRKPKNTRTELRATNFDLRERVKHHALENTSNNSPFPEQSSISPIDAFFSGPSPLTAAANVSLQKPSIALPQNRQAGQRELGHLRKPQEHRPSLAELQAFASPIAKELNDQIVSNGDRIYAEALSSLSTIHKELAKTIAEGATEDDRIIDFVNTSEKKIFKFPAETRVKGGHTGDDIQIGKRIAAGKEHVETIEAEVASLWQQWEAAQKEVDDIRAELTCSLDGGEGGQMRLVDGVQESLAAEMAKFEAELTAILEDAHEDARASERGFSKKVKGILSGLLQQYFLDD